MPTRIPSTPTIGPSQARCFRPGWGRFVFIQEAERWLETKNRPPGRICEGKRRSCRWLKYLIDPGTVVELRAPDLDTGNGFKIAVAGFFDTDHLTAMAVAADHPGVRAR